MPGCGEANTIIKVVYVNKEKYCSGPRTEPWRTSCSTYLVWETDPLIETYCCLFARYDENHLLAIPRIP